MMMVMMMLMMMMIMMMRMMMMMMMMMMMRMMMMMITMMITMLTELLTLRCLSLSLVMSSFSSSRLSLCLCRATFARRNFSITFSRLLMVSIRDALSEGNDHAYIHFI